MCIKNVCCYFRGDGVEPTVTNLLLGRKIVGHLYFDRIPLEDIPEGEEEAALWLRELYNKKVLS